MVDTTKSNGAHPLSNVSTVPPCYILFGGKGPTHYVLFGGTVPPCYILFGGTVPPRYVLFGGLVLPNSFSLKDVIVEVELE